ncbi:MAG: uroporphyrinogen-III C-methyltransferase [Nitrospirae bacterium]|nr:uroporphyrinogen-III C-methyltransferase [Nitrospirota bacterium]
MRPAGIVYLVGAGPGDPKLITLRGMECLRKADVVLYDALVPRALLAEVREGATVQHVGSRFGESRAAKRRRRARIQQLMAAHARRGRVVVRLKGGDPFVFGRGGEEAEFLHRNRVNFEVVPGVTSAVAVPSSAGIPATHRNLSSALLVLTGHKGSARNDKAPSAQDVAAFRGTVVYLMGLHSLDRIARELLAAGMPPNRPAAAIQWGTTADQKVVRSPVRDLALRAKTAGIDSPAIVVVGPVVTLSERLNWFERKPLFGVSVVVTRPLEQSRAMVEALEEAGARVTACPTIRVQALREGAPLRRALRELETYDYVIFTSANGVRYFFEAMERIGRDARAMSRARMVAIGPETARAIEARGIRTDIRADEFVAEGILKKLGARRLAGKRILIPRALDAREVLPDTLRARGARVDVIPMYRTLTEPGLAARLRRLLADTRIDCVTFTSSSTVRAFFEKAPRGLMRRAPCMAPNRVRRGIRGRASPRWVAACIGPVTARALREYHRGPTLVAKSYAAAGLVDEIIRYFRPRRRPPRRSGG